MRLVERVRAFGVTVHQPARVIERVWRGGKWRIALDVDGRQMQIEADFLADAGGRRDRSARHRAQTGARTLAVYAYWRGASLPAVPQIEAGEDAWFWGVPLPDQTYNTLAFVDPKSFRSVPGSSLAQRFLTLLGRSSLMQDCRDAELSGPVRAIDATPYLADDCVAPNAIRLGDAALAIDPISSSGVQKAIASALSGAVVANTLLRRPDSDAGGVRLLSRPAERGVGTAPPLDRRALWRRRRQEQPFLLARARRQARGAGAQAAVVGRGRCRCDDCDAGAALP